MPLTESGERQQRSPHGHPTWPPAVLASLLGVHIQTAVNWASHTRRDWTTYLAERVRVSTPAPGNTARSEYVLSASTVARLIPSVARFARLSHHP
jgi:hypothetical protein